MQSRRETAAWLPGAGPRVPAVLLPGAEAGHWELWRLPPGLALSGGGQTSRQQFASLDDAARQLTPGEPFVLELPTELGIVQRFALPGAEPAELEEMARIQIEKIMPYAAESVAFALEEISRTESEVVVAAQVVHHDRLMILGEPLAARACWPTRVTLRASAMPPAAPGGGLTAFLYAESGKSILGISENGHLCFAQALSGTTPGELAAELPAVLLGAELDGVPTHCNVLRLDRRCEAWRETLASALGTPVELFDPGAESLSASSVHAGDLAPPHWRAERQRVNRLADFKRRLLIGAGIYVGILLLGLLAVAALRIRLGWINSRLDAVRPAAEAVQVAEQHWKALLPAVDPSRYVIETMLQVYECLPPGNAVRLTSFSWNRDGVVIQGEAPSPAVAAEFSEKLKARPGLKRLHFRADAPEILSDGHARFRIAGSSS